MGERFECSTVGRVVLTVVMGVLAAAILLFNLPPGPPRTAVYPVAARVLFPLGLDQDWSLFAPDPRNASVGLYARISYADGRELIWKPPDRGHVLAPYRTYRWQKYIERARADDFHKPLGADCPLAGPRDGTGGHQGGPGADLPIFGDTRERSESGRTWGV
ncbi:MAG: hypothetical protein WKF83_05475 [Nocardioidaceae bacterium]